jgi:hypothetical protein
MGLDEVCFGLANLKKVLRLLLRCVGSEFAPSLEEKMAHPPGTTTVREYNSAECVFCR